MPDDSKLDEMVVTAAPVPAKTARKPSDDLPLAKRARARIGKMLKGAEKHGTLRFFVGPVDAATIKNDCKEFDTAVTAAKVASTGKHVTGSGATQVIKRSEEAIASIRGFVEVFYGYGTEGRSIFYTGPGLAGDPEAQMAAVIAGVTFDRTDEKDDKGKVTRKANNWIPKTAETELSYLLPLQSELSTAVKLAAAGHEDRETVASRRDTLGARLRKYVAPMEKLIRGLSKKTPEKLADYGLRTR